MNTRRNWVIVVIISATAGFFALQNGLGPVDAIATNTPAAEFTITDTPSFTPTYEGCSFMWANHDDVELSEKVNGIVRAFEPRADANANLYGEDCVYADGHSTFSTMETDFYVHLPTQDLTDKQAFGNWMKLVMDAFLQIPDDEIQGNDGFVEFWFIKSETDNLIVRVPIDEYKAKSQGKSGSELFRLFYKNP
jgi:hypothetical protein